MRTHIEIKASANRLGTPLDEVSSAVSNPVKGLRPDDVGIGVTVCEDAFPLCVLIRLDFILQLFGEGPHIVLVQGGKHGPIPSFSADRLVAFTPLPKQHTVSHRP